MTPLNQIGQYQQKPGVTGTISNEINFALDTARNIFNQVGKRLVITSLADGKHMTGSLHYQGQAVDLRTSDLSPREKQTVFSDLYNKLFSKGYDVVLESDHIHIEYDPKGDRKISGEKQTEATQQRQAQAQSATTQYKLPSNIRQYMILGIGSVMLIVALYGIKKK